MAEKIHYDDNMFFLTALIRTIDDGLGVNVDADYFGEKIIEDVLFIDTAIQKIHGSLKQNTHLIRRDVHLHALMKLKKSYGRMIENLLSLEGAFAQIVRPMAPKIRRSAASHLNDVREIREHLGRSAAPRIDGDMISSDELHFLMTPMDDASESAP